MKFFKLLKAEEINISAPSERNIQADMEKEAAKIKELENGLILEKRPKEGPHPFTPHFHLSKGKEDIGEVAVEGPNKKIDKCEKRNFQYLQQAREYVYSNKELLTEIFFTQDGDKIKELSKLLP